jgi:hypothetical protein
VRNRLSVEQEELIVRVRAAMALPPSGQVRLLWRHLRQIVLPEVPKRGRAEDTIAYAIRQAQWQRIAALAVESHVAATKLLSMEIEYLQMIDARAQGQAAPVTPEHMAAELRARVRLLPIQLQEELLQELAASLGVRVEGAADER